MASASVPANGPSPAEISSSTAHISSGTLRNTLSSSRVGSRQSARSPANVLLAGSASSSPDTVASRVPITDIANVSSVAGSSFARKETDRLGWSNSARNRPMRLTASPEKNLAHCKSSDQKLAPTSTATATTNQQARQRASNSGGGSR